MFVEVYRRLFESFGPQHWWPAESRLEVVVGAVLTQNTNWRNVERAIANLKRAEVLTLRQMCDLDIVVLGELIRPAGTYRVKAKRLKNVLHFVEQQYGNLSAMFGTELNELRAALLRVNGVGPETADSILLYAGDYPTFVVDAYTARIVKRHDWIHPDADYHQLKQLFETNLPHRTVLFNEFHALLVMTGKDFCKPIPQCDECPLREMLPAGGPRDLPRLRK